MSWLSGYLRRQSQLLLTNPLHAMLYAMILAVLPYTAWMSVALIALVVLRKSSKESLLLLIITMSAHMAISIPSMTVSMSLMNTALFYVPCFIAAYILRITQSWRAVVAVCFMQILLVALLLQWLTPGFILAQYQQIQTALNNMPMDSGLLQYLNDKNGSNQLLLANYFLGIQAVAVFFSAILSLMFARSVQSQLYYPGGFNKEMRSFRSDRVGLLLLILMLYGASLGNVLAINLLPILLFYFLFAGLSLSLSILSRKKMVGSLLLLVTPLFLLPHIMLPVYVIFGSLDSLFNFRLYLQNNAGKRT